MAVESAEVAASDEDHLKGPDLDVVKGTGERT
jgi:hypothetical protein